jgi:hypothetical protein
MKSELVKAEPALAWELLDAVEPRRMLSAEELKAAMGFDLTAVENLHEGPPCAHHALSSQLKCEVKS